MMAAAAGGAVPAPARHSEDEPVYVISVAASLAELHPQTLRQYDRLGLVTPARVNGRNRLYSMRDIRMLRRVQALGDAGINLTGIMRILELEDEVTMLRDRIDDLTGDQHSRALVLARPRRRRPR